MSKRRMTWPIAARAALIAGASLGLAACGGDMTDLEQYVGDVKARPGGRIDPLPTVEPYASYNYSSNNMRSPFVPEKRLRQSGPASNGIRPSENRNREFLESFPLDTMRMVG